MKNLPPITNITIVWVITAIPLYKIDFLGVSLPNYTLFLLLNAAFFFGYLRGEELSTVVRLTMSLILALWCAHCFVIFSNIFPLDFIKIFKSSNSATLLLFNSFLVFFFSVLSLSPLLVGTFGKHSSKMAFLVSLPVLVTTSSIDFKDSFSVFLSAGLIVSKISAIMAAVNLVYFINLHLRRMSGDVPKRTLSYRTKPGVFFPDEKEMGKW